MSTKWSTEVLGKGGGTDFASLLKDESTIILLRGKNVFGDFVYCYLKINYPDIERLKTAIAENQRFNISDFGSVLAAGKGEPSDEVKTEIAGAYPMLDQPKSLLPDAPESKAAPLEKKNWDEY